MKRVIHRSLSEPRCAQDDNREETGSESASDRESAIEEKLKKYRFKRPFSCQKCRTVLEYRGLGLYFCPHCEHEMLDDYGKVRVYMDENKMAVIPEIACATGVAEYLIRDFISEGLFENEEEFGALECAGCGKKIAEGRYCRECMTKLVSGIDEAFNEAEKARKEQENTEKNENKRIKMHFLKHK